MPYLGFKGPHTDETKEKIALKLKGKRPGGFNIKIECEYCKNQIAKPNLKRHQISCKRLYECLHVFPDGISLVKLKHMNICLRGKYKIDIYDYVCMHENQNGKCKICQKKESILCIDHCHLTNKIRGLLCRHCNLILGKWNDNIEIFESAIKYLKDDPYKD